MLPRGHLFENQRMRILITADLHYREQWFPAIESCGEMHHIPPIAFPGSTREETEAAELFLAYRPDYSVSGHSNQFPYFPGSTWRQIVDGVNVLVPGQLLNAPFPNHVVLNTEQKRRVGKRPVGSGFLKTSFTIIGW
jgi:hypothetical protein